MKKESNFIKNSSSRGIILLNVLIFAVIAIIITTALTTWATTILKSSKQLTSREQAFQIAEAGVDYYRWHLAHAQTDYYDGNGVGSTGPYIHNFTDINGNVIGQYALTITPPPAGSTIVVIKSRGTVTSDPSVYRIIQTTLGIPSLAKYAVAANDVMRFGAGTEIFGPIQSNSGIRFDGIAHNLVSSAVQHYDDTDSDSCNTNDSLGVHTCVGIAAYPNGDPNWSNGVTTPSRPDVFLAGRQFPVPAIDFVGMTTNLSQMKADAQSNGKYYAASGAQGYYILLKTNDTFDIYKVNSLTSASSACQNDDLSQANWGTWSINTKTLIQAGVPFPTNGIIFVEDNVWIDGQINSARVTIAAGKFPYSPATQKSITVNNNLTYTNFNGQDTIALISQGDINTGLTSADTLTIDAALIAQNGRAGRYYYSSNCGSTYTRTTINLYGMIASDLRYGYAYTDGTGYQNRNINYDTNLLYSPPPEFPLTSSQYTTVSWDEVKQ